MLIRLGGSGRDRTAAESGRWNVPAPTVAWNRYFALFQVHDSGNKMQYFRLLSLDDRLLQAAEIFILLARKLPGDEFELLKLPSADPISFFELQLPLGRPRKAQLFTFHIDCTQTPQAAVPETGLLGRPDSQHVYKFLTEDDRVIQFVYYVCYKGTLSDVEIPDKETDGDFRQPWARACGTSFHSDVSRQVAVFSLSSASCQAEFSFQHR